MKRLNRLLLLGFLGTLGGLTASGQVLTSTRVSLNDPDAKFSVDGQVFNYNQNFVWPEGSTHIIEFPTSFRGDDPQAYQFDPSERARYTFGSWTPVSQIPFNLPSGTTVTITASRTLTEVNGTVIKEFPVLLQFLQGTAPVTDGCSPTVEIEQIDRAGVLFVDNSCYAVGQTIWMVAGVHSFRAFPYPGYYFSGTVFDGGFKPQTPFFDMEIDSTTTISPLFERTKRVRFSTLPAGLQVLVDRAPITPAPYATEVIGPTCNDVYQLTPKTPLGIAHMCIGDFDFVPSSVHVIAAQDVQRDPQGDYWIFDKFSTGMGQNWNYVIPNDIYVRTDIQAQFIHGVRSTIDTSTAGLRVVIDGKDVPPSGSYGFIWAEGSTHHLAPPATQRDSKGRVWKFVSWSDGGAAEHDVTVPVGGGDFRISGKFAVLGQIQVTSAPAGITLKVNGTDCTTPCTFDKDPGQTLSFEAVKSFSKSEGTRGDFDTWVGGTGALAQQATFTSDVQVFKAQYHTSHRLLAYANPDGAAKFTFSPESADGYYAEGTTVQITAVPNTGYKFLVWDQDLTSKSAVEHLTIVGPSSVLAKLEKIPVIAPAVIRNAAGDTPDGTVAPGSIIAIYGSNLAADLQIGPSNPLAQAIGDVYVTVNDRVLPLIFVSPTQINAQLLSSLVDGNYVLTIHNTGKTDITGSFTVKRNSPGVFYNVTDDGMPLVAALHQDGSPVTEASPAKKGETISFFGTGLGQYDRPIIDGFLLPSTEVYKLLDPVKVLAGIPGSGTPSGANSAVAQPVVRDPAFAGGASGMVGTNLIKITIDTDLPAGKILELSVTANGVKSNTVQLPVQ